LANPEHLAKLKGGTEAWNSWRKEHLDIEPDLMDADLHAIDLGGALSRISLAQENLTKAIEAHSFGTKLTAVELGGADLRRCSLHRSNLSKANLNAADLRNAKLDSANLTAVTLREASLNDASLRNADLISADLSEADLSRADLSGANLSKALLIGANLYAANLYRTNAAGAHLTQSILHSTGLVEANPMGADLQEALLINTKLQHAKLTGCFVYGIAAWDVHLAGAIQSNLTITPKYGDQAAIEVDSLDVTQFIYLLLNNRNIRHVIDTITSKIVLILGRFSDERKLVLEAIRGELRKRNYLPVLFDFEKPSSRDRTETISTLAHMARFVIADITDAKSVPQELMAIVPDMPSVPVQPLLLTSQQEYGMFEHFRRYPWVLEPVLYDDQQMLLEELSESVIAPAEMKAKELARK
jgi:uncharacterized protein YjbI with pentapeptide repeats